MPGPRAQAASEGAPLLRIRGLSVAFERREGPAVPVIDGVALDVPAGRTVALVGESGSGKSLTALSILRLLPSAARITAGRIEWEGRDLLSLTQRELQSIRGRRIGMIFQEPMTALNPLLTIGVQVAESVEHHEGLSRRDSMRRAIDCLARVAMPDPERIARCFPHQLSGGMRQRAMIASVLAPRPALIIADEPTTALDVTIQNQVLWLLRELSRTDGLALLLITHDLGVVSAVADELAVMYAGRIVETGPTAEIIAAPRHPYTRALLRCVPRGGATDQPLGVIPGTVPAPGQWPSGCRFHPRCDVADGDARCMDDAPPMVAAGPLRAAACWKSERLETAS